jgi:hypothetical protein
VVGSIEFIIAQSSVSAASLASVFIAGRRGRNYQWIAWPLLVIGHGLFLLYSLLTGQWGFVPLNVGMMLAGLFNWWTAAHSVLTATATADTKHTCPECRYSGPRDSFVSVVGRGPVATRR